MGLVVAVRLHIISESWTFRLAWRGFSIVAHVCPYRHMLRCVRSSCALHIKPFLSTRRHPARPVVRAGASSSRDTITNTTTQILYCKCSEESIYNAMPFSTIREASWIVLWAQQDSVAAVARSSRRIGATVRDLPPFSLPRLGHSDEWLCCTSKLGSKQCFWCSETIPCRRVSRDQKAWKKDQTEKTKT